MLNIYGDINDLILGISKHAMVYLAYPEARTSKNLVHK